MSIKKRYKIAIGILLGVALILLLASVFITNIISKKVVQILEDQNIENLHLSIEKTKFSIFDRSLVFNEVHLGPTKEAMAKLHNKKLEKKKLQKISVSRIKLRGIQLTPLLLSKELKINKLIIDNPLFQEFSNSAYQQNNDLKKKSVQLDSIFLKDLNGFRLENIKITNLKVQLIDVKNSVIHFENKPLSFEVTGIKLEELSESYFKLSPVKEVFEITRIKVDFPKIKYHFSIDALKYHYGTDLIQLSGLKYKPLINKYTLTNSFKYNSEVYDVLVKDLKIFNFDLKKAVQNNGVFMDSLQVTGLALEIFKDKRKPFDLSRRPKFPHQLLKETKFPLHIPKISIKEGELLYEEKLEHKGLVMKVTMKDLKANIFNVSSIKKYREAPLKVDLSTKLMGKGHLNVDMLLPLADDQNTFYFSGFLGPSKMTYFDDVVVPALGLKIYHGQIDKLSFQASATNYNSQGTMKMYYHSLEADVYKMKKNEKNKFLTWSVNNLIYDSNPGHNGELREGMMKFERVIYKGFGNFLWKTLQNGIVNSIAPFGMTKEKVEAKKKRKLKREERRKKKSK